MCDIRLVEEAGVDFDPANGGRFRASTQAVAGTNGNAKEVRIVGNVKSVCTSCIRALA